MGEKEEEEEKKNNLAGWRQKATAVRRSGTREMKKKRKHASIKQTNKPNQTKPNSHHSSCFFLSLIFYTPFYSFFPMFKHHDSPYLMFIVLLLPFVLSCLPACLLRYAMIPHDFPPTPSAEYQETTSTKKV
ncbi:uncharacterized protein ARB_05609 [Trichophyton benhamiae CBS 112371]|uniref:Uncharacterized protein n=1 Tax=Arthroderma benhamiae (strain ATCC MYA-4681 / CBS 112371) TaxID=663331 RepID=D4AN05_ARTBC|nr:uncharacterized protein ARB_05609 [Trichophyton benhamiae CBS 112371]EFE35566.1 hypothetical protein ARB_05609 [Trichophyton benhamiae CBS 112371]